MGFWSYSEETCQFTTDALKEDQTRAIIYITQRKGQNGRIRDLNPEARVVKNPRPAEAEK